ncbi:hypothetical protein I317_06121 [Kwoniella heveanensis CBS 569]|uniref:Uncharacterized protein n=1 Tax=Kwoniella heveanensis BCC8398 TaxID=1296120 RepID=A0A1B9GKP2_9TREE|nr:hypothetical protein I316_06635 [Kwoniella heveanensis BCC8398]OCF40046.1 hypothetical protein I317_06121 [Kwoniella heveanensis CBS 569]
MAIVEEVAASGAGLSSPADLLKRVEELSEKLALPRELVVGFMAQPDADAIYRYRIRALNTVKGIKDVLKEGASAWGEIAAEDQLKAVESVLRLNGDDEWSSYEIRAMIDDLLPVLSPSIPLLILPTLRQYFASHPSLTSASRALERPRGGQDSTIDLHDHQPFKSPAGWGVINLLAFAISKLTADQTEKNIGLIIPPTLVLMDDWEPCYRQKGARILSIWMDKLDRDLIKRMGIDKLLLDSLIHTISLNSNPPLGDVLDITLKLTFRCREEGEKRTKVLEDIMEKGIVQGWVYAPSGLEGREVSIHIARMMERMCGVMGTGITRWLKTVIPHLLQPLQYPPTPLVIPHYLANLSCLLCVVHTVRPTCRISRWRGQILNVLSRLWVQLHERGLSSSLDDVDDGDEEDNSHTKTQLQTLIRQVFDELIDQIPSIREDELPRIRALAPHIFAELIPTA